ncbi:MAG: conjugal transfer protein TraX [Legionella sp.]|nr:conjugal transfer protein TraX [Legionella sp.]
MFPTLRIPSGSLEGLKWLGLISMTVDHANRFFLAGHSETAYCIGRLALPLFAFVFAYNLSSINLSNSGHYQRILKRLLFFGVLAIPGYMAMKQLSTPWPFNILFVFLIALLLFVLQTQKNIFTSFLAVLVFLLGGLLVEYSWCGIFFCFAAWSYCRKPSLLTATACFLAYWFLDYLNGNAWALLSLPIIFLAGQTDFKIKRIPHLFYYYYPAHLTFFWALQYFLLSQI